MWVSRWKLAKWDGDAWCTSFWYSPSTELFDINPDTEFCPSIAFGGLSRICSRGPKCTSTNCLTNLHNAWRCLIHVNQYNEFGVKNKIHVLTGILFITILIPGHEGYIHKIMIRLTPACDTLRPWKAENPPYKNLGTPILPADNITVATPGSGQNPVENLPWFAECVTPGPIEDSQLAQLSCLHRGTNYKLHRILVGFLTSWDAPVRSYWCRRAKKVN